MNGRRGGFSMVELLIVAVLGAMVVTAIYQTIITHERSSRQHTAMITTSQNNRTVLDVLATELRELDASDDDLTMATRDSLSFRAYRRLGVICNISGSGTTLDVWIVGSGFEAGDSLFIYADRDTTLSKDDRWITARVNSVGASGCTGWTGSGQQRLNLDGGVASAVLADVTRGSPVRGYDPRRFTYGMFVNSKGARVLGRRTPGGAVTELIGPLSSTRGLVLQYYDTLGTELANPNTAALRRSVARIGVTVRAEAIGANGSPPYTDSLSTHLFLRNNR